MAVQPQVDQVHKLELEHKRLKEQNKKLQAQLEQVLANCQGLETIRKVQQSEINRQEVEKRGLEVTISTLGHFINDLIEDKKVTEIPGDVRRMVSEIIFVEKKKQGNMQQKSRNTPVNKPLIKSQSTGRLQLNSNAYHEEIRFNSLNAQTRDDLQRTVQRTSNFFSNQHNNILKQKLYHNVSPNLSNIDLTILENDNEENEKNNNMNDINTTLVSNTPSSPNNNTPTLIIPTEILEETISDTKKIDNHPLSNCDVAFTFGGTRELKHIKNNRSLSRNSSPNLMNTE